MTAEQFVYWLQGFLEMSGPDVELSSAQTKMLREHLATVFVKVTPPLQAVPSWTPSLVGPLEITCGSSQVSFC
jgi:hypothetical protein